MVDDQLQSFSGKAEAGRFHHSPRYIRQKEL
jgi:hypothetical protein